MLHTITFITLSLIAGAGSLLLALRHAPEGHEDEQGFHFKDANSPAAFAYYNAFAGQQPKRYPAKVAVRHLAA